MVQFLNQFDSTPNQNLNQLSEEELEKLKLKELENFYGNLFNPSQSSAGQKVNKELNNQLASVYSGVNQSFGNPTKKLSLTELQADPEFSETAERFMLSLGKDENIIEYLRDSDFSLSSALVRSSQSGNWDEQTKQDYNYLRSRFDNAELSGFKEYMGLVKDMGVDIIADPLNWLAAAFFPVTGGSSGAVATASANAAKQGLKQLTKESISFWCIKSSKRIKFSTTSS